MSKYYVTFGNLQYIVGRDNIWDACRATLSRWMDLYSMEDDMSVFDTISLPTEFRVSEVGFTPQNVLADSDVIVSMTELLIDENQIEKEWMERELRKIDKDTSHIEDIREDS